MALQFKRGSELERQDTLLASGEPYFVTNYASYGVSPFYIGDGVTMGGVPVLNITNLHELYDVYIVNPLDKQIVQWSTANGRWENKTNVELAGTLAVDGQLTLNASNIIAPNRAIFVTTNETYNAVTSVINAKHRTNSTSPYTGIITNGVHIFVTGTGLPAFPIGTAIKLLNVTGTNLSSDLRYYTYQSTSTNYKIASSYANAVAGVGMVLTGSYTGGPSTTSIMPAEGVGTGIQFVTNTTHAADGTPIDVTGTRLESVATDVTYGSEDFDLVIRLTDDGVLLERFRLTSDGLLTVTSINGSAGTFTSLNATGNVGINGNLTVAGSVNFTGAPSFSTGATFGGAVTIGGNFTVNGTTTNIDTVNLVIEDNIILLNKNQTTAGVTAGTAGIEIERGSLSNVQWVWDETNTCWSPAGDIANANIFAGGDIIAGTRLGTNGNEIILNIDDVSSADSKLIVRRGASADVAVKWNESTDAWQFTNDGTTYIDMPGPTSSPLFAGLTIDGSEIANQNGVTITPITGAISIAGERGVQMTAQGAGGVAIAASTVNAGGVVSLNGYATTISSANTVTITTPVTYVNGNIELGGTSGNTVKFNGNVSNRINFNEISGQKNGIAGVVGSNDAWFVGGSSTSVDAGYLELAVGDNNTEGVYVRRYNGSPVSGGVVGKEITLLDASGNSSFPGHVRIEGGNTLYADYLSGNNFNNGTTVRALGSFITDGKLYANAAANITGNLVVTGTATVGSGTLSYNATTARLDFNKPVTTANGNGLRISQDLYGADLHGFLVAGATGNVVTGGNIYLNRSNSAYNGGSANASIVVDRIATDASITWNETFSNWIFTNDVNVEDGNVNASSMSVDSVAYWNSSALSTTSTAATNLHSFSTASYRSSKYTVQMTRGTDYQVVEIMVLHNGTTGFITTYGDLNTGVNLATFDADVSGGFCRLRVTPTSATLTEFKVDRTIIVV